MATPADRCLSHTQVGKSLPSMQRVLLGVQKMKMFFGGLAVTLGILSSSVSAEVMVNVNGTEYTLTALMENCQSMGDTPAAQIACFNAVTTLLDQQSNDTQPGTTASVPEALNALRTVAQYQDTDSGLMIVGSDCNAQILYYANFFHVSRRNVSSLDLFSTRFDASEVAYDQIAQAPGGQAHISRGAMHTGAVAATIGGMAIESAKYNIAPKPGRMTIADYASEVANQLTASESSQFDFVLVHPAKHQSSAEIWGAFKTYVQACQRQ
ncbi:MAG: hypothetical protein AB8B51_02530 [Sedimentitalea sp.]